MENLKEEIQVHPADVLAKALERASGVLGVLGQLYETDQDSFVSGNAFVAHAISTSSALIAEAKTALEDLHYSCDLTVLNSVADSETVIEMNFGENASPPTVAEVVIPTEQFETQPEPQAAEVTTASPPQEEQIAQTYLELLRKLTAAEVFAAEQQALSVPGASTQLLPLLRSLREDLQKIHSAA
jgi:hypothetical protein